MTTINEKQRRQRDENKRARKRDRERQIKEIDRDKDEDDRVAEKTRVTGFDQTQQVFPNGSICSDGQDNRRSLIRLGAGRLRGASSSQLRSSSLTLGLQLLSDSAHDRILDGFSLSVDALGAIPIGFLGLFRQRVPSPGDDGTKLIQTGVFVSVCERVSVRFASEDRFG
jgi:hypothetical protein